MLGRLKSYIIIVSQTFQAIKYCLNMLMSKILLKLDVK